MNREKFADAAAAAPEAFSSLQLSTYLKRSLFKQQIEGFKRGLAKTGEGQVGAGNREALGLVEEEERGGRA